MSNSRNDDPVSNLCSCGCVVAFNLAFGGVCFDYVLSSITGKDVPWYADAIAGLFLGQFAAPLAVICWIMRLCGVDAPFVVAGGH